MHESRVLDVLVARDDAHADWLGAIAATTGVVGTFLGGWLTDRLSHRDLRWYAWIPGWGSVVVVPFVLLF